MITEEEKLKKIVRDKYDKIARQEVSANKASCCGATDVSREVYNIMAEDYSELGGYTEEADLGLGCGLPTQYALIQPGNTVLDLGSGAGNDCFVAREETGDKGKVIGIDFTPTMIEKARKNAEKFGYNNIEFREGDIEKMPVTESSIDVAVSNCVLNLVPNKENVFKELFRVIKPGGHFSISDIVLTGDLPEELKRDAEMYAGCVSGAIQKDEYLNLIKKTGFENIVIQKEKPIYIPKDILSKYLDENQIEDFNKENGIFSLSIFASKPGKLKINLRDVQQSKECEPNSGCC